MKPKRKDKGEADKHVPFLSFVWTAGIKEERGDRQTGAHFVYMCVCV